MERHDELPETYIRRRMNRLNEDFEGDEDLRREIRNAANLFDRNMFAPRAYRLKTARQFVHLSDRMLGSRLIHINYGIVLCHRAAMTWRQIGLAMGIIINKTDQKRFAETLDCLWGEEE